MNLKLMKRRIRKEKLKNIILRNFFENYYIIRKFKDKFYQNILIYNMR